MRWLVVLVIGFSLVKTPAEEEVAGPVTIKARMNRGRVILPAKVNSGREYFFMLDSACTIPTLHPELIDELKVEASGSVRIEGIAGEERAPTYRNVVFDFGGAAYKPRRVASISWERSESRNRRDGVIGSSFFRRFVVEIDPASEMVRLHNPTNYQYSGKGKIVPLTFRKEIPVVSASIVMKGKEPLEAQLEFDTGCDSGLCLGEPFVEKSQILGTADSRGGEKFGVGGTVQTKDIRVPELRLGEVKLKNVQTDCFLEGSPVDDPLAGHMGMAGLRGSRVIIDYQRRRMIIEGERGE